MPHRRILEALQDVVVMDMGGSRRLAKGERYELGPGLANDLARAGYVIVMGGEGVNSAATGREGEEAVDGISGEETAAIEANERAVAPRPRRKRKGN